MKWPVLLAGQWVTLPTTLEVRSPFDGRVVGQTTVGQDEDFEVAAAAATAVAPAMGKWPAHARIQTLRAVADALRADRESLALTLSDEAGKPLRDARTEVERAAFVFDTTAGEIARLGGDVIPIDLMPHGEGRLALTRRVPLGPIAAITPFNFPLLLVAHKLAPALGAGNPVVLKPATRTPLSALRVAALLHDHGVPPGALSVLPMARGAADRLVTDERFKLLTFTGSAEVGWAMKARAGHKRVVLELGGNAGVIVDKSADLDFAVRRVVAGGFTFAGQSCISVQRVYVHEAIADVFAERLTAAVAALKVGDPRDAANDVGPMISHDDVDRIRQWVRDAVTDGARVRVGGEKLSASLFAPTVIERVPAYAQLCREEAFAPIVGLYRFTHIEDAIEKINASRYGLQAGVFTADLAAALMAFDRLEVGGVIINDVPTYRVDSMPYGGVKDSGSGREGPRYALEEMTELKLLVINQELR